MNSKNGVYACGEMYASTPASANCLPPSLTMYITLFQLALAFRSLATVAVYFYQREHRIEVANAKALGRRLSSRIRRAMGANAGTVQFQNEGLEHVRMIPQGGPSLLRLLEPAI